MKSSASSKSVLKVLDYTKTNKKWFDDKDLIAGYHTVQIQGDVFRGQRDPAKRLAKVDYDFNGKRVLDVGCSNGGLLHALADEIAFGVGVDFNSKCINAANALKAVNQIENIHFYTFDLDKEDINMLCHFVLGEPVDICFFFNISIWVKRWKEVFMLCSEQSQTLLFEAHGSDEQQAEQLAFVKSVYQYVEIVSEQSDDDPTYAKRKMYQCTKKIERRLKQDSVVESNFLQNHTEATIIETYQKAFPKQKVNSVKIYPSTHESVVADVDGDFIVKFPKPSRGIDGLIAEQSITDFMKGKLDIEIPRISLHNKPILMARYEKLQGSIFDKSKYSNLLEGDKDKLAQQIAKLILSFHNSSKKDVQKNKLVLTPSWDISTKLIQEQLLTETEHVIKILIKEVVKNHDALRVPEENKVLGHFDLHGGNILMTDDHKSLSGVIDFGNCKIGDLHQDLSVMNLSSPDLAKRIAQCYEKISHRKLNRLLVQHYTTIFYLNLLAGLKRSQSDQEYQYWLSELNQWYDYLLKDRASIRLRKRPPISAIPTEWKKWISSNLMKGLDSSELQKVLREKGFSDIDIESEILLAQEHPFVQAGKEIFHTLQKRNWLLNTCDTLASLDKSYSTKIKKIKTPSFKSFVEKYYSKNLPIVLTDGVDHWPALGKWTPEYLLKEFGDKEIEVQSGRDQDPLFERNSGKHKKKMLMKEFIQLIQNKESSNDFYMTANNTKNSFSSLEKLFEDVNDFGKNYRQKDTIKSGNLFWFGPKGTFTPVHHDLTNNMLVQILGRKKITLIPAFQVPWLYNDKGVFSATDFPNIDLTKHPLARNVTLIEFILKPGESLFIPIGWWHCVESLDVSISISFTNFDIQNSFSDKFPKR